MYKVLIVDDDMFVRMGFKTSIDWEKHNFTVIGEAPNGVKAMELIQLNPPDIVITDIKMPLMDGIELIQNISDRYPAIKCIVLSNYNDFELVKEAMKKGAIDYFYKVTINVEEVIKNLEKVCERIENERNKVNEVAKLRKVLGQNRSAIVKGFFSEVLSGDIKKINEKEMDKKCNALGLKVSIKNGSLLLVKILNYETLLNSRFDGDLSFYTSTIINFLEEVMNNNVMGEVYDYQSSTFVLLIHRQNNEENNDLLLAENIQIYLNVFLGIKASVIYDIYYKNMNELKQIMDEIDRIKLMGFYDDKESLIAYKGSDSSMQIIDEPNQHKGILNALSVYIKMSDSESIFNTIFHFLEEMRKRKIKPSKLKNMMIMVFVYMNTILMEEYGEEFNYDYLHITGDINDLLSFNELNEFCKVFLSKYTGLLKKHINHNYNSDILKAMSYMQLNYMSKIKLDDVAMHVSMNKSYLSRLFKQETGVNFHHYLQDIRMKKAHEYLRDTDKNISSIAQEIGYTDIFYFDRVFKNYYKVSPSEYRKGDKANET
ncbi:MAG: response regulator [Clostridia bacterium]|nr:response regulator [Clostridia bacterium]